MLLRTSPNPNSTSIEPTSFSFEKKNKLIKWSEQTILMNNHDMQVLGRLIHIKENLKHIYNKFDN